VLVEASAHAKLLVLVNSFKNTPEITSTTAPAILFAISIPILLLFSVLTVYLS